MKLIVSLLTFSTLLACAEDTPPPTAAAKAAQPSPAQAEAARLELALQAERDNLSASFRGTGALAPALPTAIAAGQATLGKAVSALALSDLRVSSATSLGTNFQGTCGMMLFARHADDSEFELSISEFTVTGATPQETSVPGQLNSSDLPSDIAAKLLKGEASLYLDCQANPTAVTAGTANVALKVSAKLDVR